MPSDALRHRRVLLVEDDPMIALDLEETLKQEGIVVVGPAGALLRALYLADSVPLDAAVLDVRLGAHTSLPLANRLAERRVPFLFQTSDPTFLDGAHAGAPVLIKPFLAKQLIGALTALLIR